MVHAISYARETQLKEACCQKSSEGYCRIGTKPRRSRADPIHPIDSQANIAAALPTHLVQFERFPNCRHAVVPNAPEPNHRDEHLAPAPIR
jgi:hypothetical protein